MSTPAFLLHKTTRAAADAILVEGFRDAPAPPVGRSGVWLADKALDIDPFLVLHEERARNGRRWAIAYCLRGFWCGWLHLLISSPAGELTDVTPCWATPYARTEAPPVSFTLIVRVALALLGPDVLPRCLVALEGADLSLLRRLRVAHVSQLSLQHGDGPALSLLGVRFPDAAVLAPWEVPGSTAWREWLVPAAVVNAEATITRLADEESDMALGPPAVLAG